MSYEFKREDAFGFAASMHLEYREKGDELEFKRCPYCDGGSGNKRDEWTFSLNLDKGVFKCLRASCERQGHFVELCRDFDYRLEFDQPKIFRQLPQKKPVTKPEAIKYLESRGISEKIARQYRITVQDSNPNVLVFPFYDEDDHLVFVKYRKTDFKKGLDKNKEWCEKDTMPILFGMNLAKDYDKPLVLTEGQIDSLSLTEAGIPNAVSVPTGASGFTWYTYNLQWLLQFKEVIVFGDCEHGHITLIDGLSARLPNDVIVKCVRQQDYLGEKDANDILRKYGAKALRYAVEHAEIPKLDNIKQLADVQNMDINKMDKIKTGIEELDRCIRGMVMGQLIILTGKRGEGKSTFMSQLVAEALDQKESVFVYSGELADFHFKYWLDLQLAGIRNVKDYPDQFGEKSYYLTDEITQKINNWYRGRAYIYDNNYLTEGSEFETLPETIEKVIRQYNVRLVCIDNLMTAMEAVNEQSNLYLAQSNFVGQLKAIAVKYSVVIVLVAHPRKASASDMMDDNDLVAGSSDITNKADVVLKYSRNTDENYECDGLIKVTKSRLFGNLKTKNDDAIRVTYSKVTRRITGTTYNETKGEKVYGWEDLGKKAAEESVESGNAENTENTAEKTETDETEEYSVQPVQFETLDSFEELPF